MENGEIFDEVWKHLWPMEISYQATIVFSKISVTITLIFPDYFTNALTFPDLTQKDTFSHDFPWSYKTWYGFLVCFS